MGAPPARIWRRSRRPGGARRGAEATAPSAAASLSGGVCGTLEARPLAQGGLLPTASLHRPSPLRTPAFALACVLRRRTSPPPPPAPPAPVSARSPRSAAVELLEDGLDVGCSVRQRWAVADSWLFP
jgi:hypothetical protein